MDEIDSSTSLTNEEAQGTTGSVKSLKSLTLTYLTSYETMVRMQDEETKKTGEFLKGTIERVRHLGRPVSSSGSIGNLSGSFDSGSVVIDKKENSSVNKNVPEGMLTYLEMRRCLLRLGFTWNRSLPQSSPASKQFYYDDDISIASGASKASRISGSSGKVLGGKRKSKKRDVVATDNQLIMLLSILVEMEERWRADLIDKKNNEAATFTADANNSNKSNDTDNLVNDKNVTRQGLFLPELVQAYKLVIGGMQALQSLDKDGTSIVAASEYNELSERLRERTKGLLRSFGPDHKLSMKQSLTSTTADATAKSRKDASHDGLTKTKNLLMPPSAMSISSPSRQPKTITDAAAFQQPRLGEDGVRKLMHTKDATLAKIVEDHGLEMNAMAHDMETLKSKEMSSREILKKKRRATRLAVLIVLGIVAIGMAYWEYQKRMWVQQQISASREAERVKAAKEIEKLTLKRNELKKQLETAQGTARYQTTRFEQLETSNNKTLKEIAAMEQKWWLEQSDMGRCNVAIYEMEGKIALLNVALKEAQEEQEWCNNRLKGREAEMNLSRQSRGGHGVVSTRSLSGASATTSARAAATKSEHSKNEKPVKLEMKYNQAVRSAIIKRQVYSGLGGVAASVVLCIIFPQTFSMFLGGGASGLGVGAAPVAKSVAKTAQKKMAAAAAPKLSKVKWIDRIHAATVVALVVRTAMFFFMP